MQVWKRKAEKYLVDSGLAYTIVRGGRQGPCPGCAAACAAPGSLRTPARPAAYLLGADVSLVQVMHSACACPARHPACRPPPQVHPGGLIDEEGGKRQLIIDVDDKLISEGALLSWPCYAAQPTLRADAKPAP